VYGLGAHALDAAAVARIFEAKGRPANNPQIVHVSGAAAAAEVVAEWPESAARLAERFWPGPLTLVLPRGGAVPAAVTAGGPTVAVRVPAHPVALALLGATGVPVAAPSANRSGYISPTCAGHVLRGLDGRIDMVLDAGPGPGGIESTVLDLTTTPPRLLRPGLLPVGEIEAVIGPVASPHGRAPTQAVLPSPGMLPRHYAPRTPLELVETGEGAGRAQALQRAGLRVGLLSSAAVMPLSGVMHLRLPSDLAGYSARLYAALYELDDAGLDRIIVELPPDVPDWLAVRDRLRRAAAPLREETP
jgi:L-threonylcarbamoyladenylate synthase